MVSFVERLKKILGRKKEIREELRSIIINIIKSIKNAESGIIFTNSGFNLVSYGLDNEEEVAAFLTKFINIQDKVATSYPRGSVIRISMDNKYIYIIKGEEISIAVFVKDKNIDKRLIEKRFIDALRKIDKILE